MRAPFILDDDEAQSGRRQRAIGTLVKEPASPLGPRFWYQPSLVKRVRDEPAQIRCIFATGCEDPPFGRDSRGKQIFESGEAGSAWMAALKRLRQLHLVADQDYVLHAHTHRDRIGERHLPRSSRVRPPWLGEVRRMSAIGTPPTVKKEQSPSALPRFFRRRPVRLWRERHRPQCRDSAHRALNLLVPQRKLRCPQMASAAVDECRFWFGAAGASQGSSGPAQCWRSIAGPAARTVAS
jgi:hypothetical protein